MKKKSSFKYVFLVLLTQTFIVLSAQKPDDKVKMQIAKTLETWSAACKNADVDKVMSMFDNTANIMVVGSDKGEINKGKDEINIWLTKLFRVADFSWEMNRIDIDYFGKTAWVFVDGNMIVNFHKGGTNITPYRFTGILVKKKGEWKWRLFDGSIPKGE